VNYKQYLSWRQKALTENPKLVDCGQLDFYKLFSLKQLDPCQGHINGQVHRCHLVEDFLKQAQLDINKKFVSVSSGVRASLVELMKLLKNREWMLPADNYPFYQKAALDNQLKFSEYATLNQDNNHFRFLANFEQEVLLITSPLKPLGRRLNSSEIDSIRFWLNQNSERILVVDAVYCRDLRSVFAEWKTCNLKQVVILYSLSKLLAAENVFGVVISEKADLHEHFKSLERNEENLQRSWSLLNRHFDYHKELEVSLTQAGQVTKRFLSEETASRINFLPGGYLCSVQMDHQILLDQGILTIPASVYRSANSKEVIFSSLAQAKP
jgi:hypothetical protein